MMMHTLERAYATVNVAGYVNDTWLSSSALERGIGELPFAQVDYARHGLPGRIVGAFDGASRNAWRNSQWALGQALDLRRSFPLLKPAALPIASVFGGLSQGLAYHPIADLIIGRGHDVSQTAPTYLGSFNDTVAGAYHKWTHHGIAGCLLEALPLQGAQVLQGGGYTGLASACMLAAVVGRLLLQVPRLLICAQAVVMDLVGIGIVTGVLFALEISLRSLIGLMSLVTDIADTSDDWRRRRMARGPGNESDIDGGGPGVDQRVRNRLTVLTFQLEPLYKKESTAVEIMAVIEGIAANLRRYCSQLPDNAALRGGLALLQATVESLWTADEGIVFDPPELGTAA